MQYDNLDEQIMVEESIASARHEEEAEHRVADDSFETLRKDRLHA
jgi:hypothetical protein